MAKKFITPGLIICLMTAVALMVGLAPLAKAADNLDRLLGLTPPSPRDDRAPLLTSLRPAPTPTRDETVRPSRGDLQTHQSSDNNQMNFNKP